MSLLLSAAGIRSLSDDIQTATWLAGSGQLAQHPRVIAELHVVVLLTTLEEGGGCVDHDSADTTEFASLLMEASEHFGDF